MTEGVAGGDVGLEEVAVVDVETFGEVVLNLSEGLVEETDAGGVVGFFVGDGVGEVAAGRG